MKRATLITSLLLTATVGLVGCSGSERSGAASSTAAAVTLNSSGPAAQEVPSTTVPPTTVPPTTVPPTTSAPALPTDRCGTSVEEISTALGQTAAAGNVVEAVPGLLVCGYTLGGTPTGLLLTIADESKPGAAGFFGRLASTTCRLRPDVAPDTCQVVQGSSISVATKVGNRTVGAVVAAAGPDPQKTADQAIALVRRIGTR